MRWFGAGQGRLLDYASAGYACPLTQSDLADLITHSHLACADIPRVAALNQTSKTATEPAFNHDQ
jgi:hypothetical protein